MNRRYRGYRNSEGAHVLYQDGDGVETYLNPKPSLKVRNHSPDGFEWGYGGSGPAQLALALLLDVTGDRRTAVHLYQAFKWEEVSHWPEDGWVMWADEIQKWVEKFGRMPEGGEDE